MTKNKEKEKKKDNGEVNSIWGGRFSSKSNDLMDAINVSIDFDKRLAFEDLRGSRAHVKMLGKADIISQDEVEKILGGLTEVETELLDGKFNFSRELEDIHMNVEGRLREIIGETAGKIHTARSRNDQVSTDLRLWVRGASENLQKEIIKLMKSILGKAEENADTIMPGFTHLQVAQPITMGHYFLSYIEMLGRDIDRFEDAQKRANECPLGSCALAGTSFEIDREFTAKELGFSRPMRNSLDAVSDRDFVIEFISCLSLTATHLSRFAEDLTIWTSDQFDFVRLPEAFTSGSSIMPQKRNPDAAELVRGKVGRVNGALISMLTVMKGLPLSYSKDMQEDKEQLFDAFDTVLLMIKVMTGIISDITPNKENLLRAASMGYSTATDLADWLTKELNIPFRDSHKITGRIVSYAERNNLKLNEVPIEFMHKLDGSITKDIYKVMEVKYSVGSRKSFGGTSPREVLKRCADWRIKLHG